MQVVPQIGSTLLDRYFVEEIIDSDGDTAILKCTDTRLDVPAVVKFLLGDDEGPGWQEKRGNFIDSFRAMARLNHPNIVHVANIETRCGLTFSVMELLLGMTLEQFVMEDGGLDPKEAVEIFLSVIDAVAMAHSGGTLHKRISPVQVMLNQQGKRLSPRVLNFQSYKKTEDLDLVHAVPFLAPEQLENFNGATEASDVFSLCATMFYVFAHRPPVICSSIDDYLVHYAINDGIVEFPDSIPAEFVPILTAGLRTNPADRQYTALTLLHEVKKIGANFKLSANLSIDATKNNRDVAFSQVALQTVEAPMPGEFSGSVKAMPSSQQSIVRQSSQSVSQPAFRQSSQSISQPAFRQSSQSISQPAFRQSSQSISQPVIRQSSQSISQPVIRQSSQSISQPVIHVPTKSQPALRPVSGRRQPVIHHGTHSQPALQQVSGSNPAVCQISGSNPAVCQISGSNPALRQINGSNPALRPVSGSNPALQQVSGSNPAVCRISGSNPAIEQMNGKTAAERASGEFPPASREVPNDAAAQPDMVPADPVLPNAQVQLLEGEPVSGHLNIGEPISVAADVNLNQNVHLTDELNEIYSLRRVDFINERSSIYAVSTHSNPNDTYCLKCFHAADEVERAVFNEGVRRGDMLSSESSYFQSILQSYPESCALLMADSERQPLPQNIMQTGVYAPSVVVQIGILLGEAMSIAHQSGFVNGNLKPSNIIFENRNGIMAPIIYDFGQRLYVDSISRLWPYELPFIAPELEYNLQKANAQADIFAFGMCLVYMLLGRVPYRSENYDVAEEISSAGQLPDLLIWRSDIPSNLIQIIRWCTAFDPAQRYVHFSDVVRDLRVIYPQL